MPGLHLETLHSLAKWKRHILTEHQIDSYSGIYVEGHYIRGYEPILDETHSLYVLQFDWEMTITKEDRNVSFLKQTVTKIFEGIQHVEKVMAEQFPS